VLCKGHPQLAGRTPGVRSRLCLFGLAPGPQLHGLACAFVLKIDHLVLFWSAFFKRQSGAVLFADSQKGHRSGVLRVEAAKWSPQTAETPRRDHDISKAIALWSVPTCWVQALYFGDGNFCSQRVFAACEGTCTQARFPLCFSVIFSLLNRILLQWRGCSLLMLSPIQCHPCFPLPAFLQQLCGCADTRSTMYK